MPTEENPITVPCGGWRVSSASVRGSSHTRRGLPNQDCCGTKLLDAGGEALILAVADGHGSRRCIRSEQGSKFAIDTALNLAAAMLAEPSLRSNPSHAKRLLELEFPRRCVAEWQRRVSEHADVNTLTEAERAVVGDPPASTIPGDRKVVFDWYGSTLLLVLLTKTWGVTLQLGDGTLVWVTPGGDVFEPPTPEDLLVGDDTHSLSSKNPAGLMRVTFQMFSETVPALVLVCTDGYEKSFRNKDAVRRAAVDILAACRSEGFAAVEKALPGWLADSASDLGSGDDTTVILAWRSDSSPPTHTPATLATQPKDHAPAPEPRPVHPTAEPPKNLHDH